MVHFELKNDDLLLIFMQQSAFVLRVANKLRDGYHRFKYPVIPISTEKDQWGMENVYFCTLPAIILYVQQLACRAISASSELLVSVGMFLVLLG